MTAVNANLGSLLIGSKWLAPASGGSIRVIDPSRGSVIGEIGAGSAEDVNCAVAAARAAFEGVWGRMPASERGRILQRWAWLIEERKETLAQIEAQDTGKPITVARNDIAVTARYFEFYGAAADKLHGQVVPFLDGYSVSLLRVPHGVTGHIIPWNYPAQQMARTIAPAMAAGNATVLKPSEDACLSSLKLAELALEAGLPPGVLNIVTGTGQSAGAALTAHPGVDFISFTGSPQAGSLVQQSAARHHIPCALELGGKSPQVVFTDADFDLALPAIVKAIIQNTGQTCSAGSRLLVQEDAYDEFVSRVSERFRAVRVGVPESDPDCGPVMNIAQRDKVNRFVRDAIQDGVPLLAEGVLSPDLPEGGFWVKPALFGKVPRDHELAREEVFGPVLAALPFTDEEDAVRLANATDYGLLGAVWTTNGDRQQRVAKRLRCGQVYINCYGAGGGVELPFGGVKKSGHGREKGFLALEQMTTTKTVVHYHG